MQHVVFDLDDTLVATRHLSDRAYASMGVTPPEDAAVRSWRDWLPDWYDGNVGEAQLAYQARQLELDRLLRTEPLERLPAGEAAARPPRDSWIAVLTKAPLIMADMMLNRIGLGGMRLLGWRTPPALRPALLLQFAPSGAYVDDQAATALEVTAHAGGWAGIACEGMTERELREALEWPAQS